MIVTGDVPAGPEQSAGNTTLQGSAPASSDQAARTNREGESLTDNTHQTRRPTGKLRKRKHRAGKRVQLQRRLRDIRLKRFKSEITSLINRENGTKAE